jgi:uncharacterized protein YndB with AHSA1/START domain
MNLDPTTPPGAGRPFIMSRTFDAPRALVWKAWTDVEELKRWFGPKGSVITKCSLDLRVGGVFHYCLRGPDGSEMWGKWVFREITAPERIALITSFSDADGGTTHHPMAPTWPLEMYSMTTFTEAAGKTTVTLNWSAYKGSALENKTFDENHDSMRQGWGGTFDQLAEYLAKL